MVSTSIVTLVFLVCLQTVLLSTVSNCAKTISMYWNTTNSIFRIDNTDHIIDVNKNNAAFEYDQVNIICPVYQPGTYDDEAEKYIIYNVSKEEYETCRITNPSPRVIAICDKPFKTMYFTITFRPFTPQPGGLEFHPGRDYYFISTSSKDDLHRRIGGRCTTHNMKVVFKVCCNNEDNSSSYPGSSRNNSIAVTSSTASTSTTTSNVNVISNSNNNNNNMNSNGNGNNNNNNNGYNANGINPSSGNGVLIPVMPPSVYKERYYPNVHQQQPPMHPSGNDHQQIDQLPGPILPHVPQLPMYPNYPHQQQPQYPNSQTPKTSITQKKKNKEYSDHPNEVVKNEELTYNGASSMSLQRTTQVGLHQHQQLVCALALLCSVLLPNLLR